MKKETLTAGSGVLGSSVCREVRFSGGLKAGLALTGGGGSLALAGPELVRDS